MLRPWQIAALTLLGVALWGLVTYRINSRPEAVLDQSRALIGFVTAPVGGLISVWLCKVVGRLSADQLLAGVAVVAAVAMMLDGAALHWFSPLYGFNEKALRLSAAGLLWGYGVGLAVAVAWSAWSARKAA